MFTQPSIEIKISTNNSTVIRAVLIFSEGIFASETFIAYPKDRGVPRIVIPFVIPKDICYDINIKALVGTENSQQFHVFELTRQLPRFSMYAVLENNLIGDDGGRQMETAAIPDDFSIGNDYVSFKTTERFQRICMWINQNFLLSNDIEPETLEEIAEFKMFMISLYDRSHLALYFMGGNEIRLYTGNIELAGHMIQSLAHFLNLDELQTVANFSGVETEIKELFRKIDGLQVTFGALSVDLSQKIMQQKSLIVRIEDARLYNMYAVSWND